MPVIQARPVTVGTTAGMSLTVVCHQSPHEMPADERLVDEVLAQAELGPRPTVGPSADVPVLDRPVEPAGVMAMAWREWRASDPGPRATWWQPLMVASSGCTGRSQVLMESMMDSPASSRRGPADRSNGSPSS